MSPDFVKTLQSGLNANSARLTVDGIYGPKTRLAEAMVSLKLPWGESVPVAHPPFHGLYGGAILKINGAGGHTAVGWTGRATIDNDGTNDADHDPSHENETSLRWPDGRSCDAYSVYGFVISLALYKLIGAKPGDYGYVGYKGLIVPAQYFDSGNTDEVGEISVALAKALKIPASPISGGAPDGVGFTIFPGSGPGVAVLRSTQESGAAVALAKVRGK